MTDPTATILIVDDESWNSKLLERLLQPDGHLTRTAANGEQALASIAERAPDLILLDVIMPGMDGYEVARTLKASLRGLPLRGGKENCVLTGAAIDFQHMAAIREVIAQHRGDRLPVSCAGRRIGSFHDEL